MSHILGRKWYRLKKILQGHPSALAAAKPGFHTSDGSCNCISPESHPGNHTLKDIGLFYKIDNELALNKLFRAVPLKPTFIEESKTFGGTHLMIRKPALEIINYLKHTNYDYPINKYVLFGKRGFGVSMTMHHVIHYAYLSDWLIVHIPNVIQWLTQNTERSASATKEGLLDLPLMGSMWLTHFKNQNLNIISKLDLRLQNSYSWNIQEENKKGESLLGIVDHGISRGNYSCDVIMALFEEIKLLSKSGKVKTLVAIDNYSVLFQPGRKSSNRKFRHLSPDQLSVTESFKNIAKADWHNGAAILSCHSEREIQSDTDHLPLNKLSKEGFEFLDPFIPIEVPRLTDMEMTNLLEFYRSKKWLLTSEGDLEIKTLSAGNIATFQTICGPL